jgi:hypothetical protein
MQLVKRKVLMGRASDVCLNGCPPGRFVWGTTLIVDQRLLGLKRC